MDITLTRVDGGVLVNPAPPYVTNYLQYSHRSLEQVKWRRENKFTKKLLYANHPEGGVVTLSGYYTHLCKLIDQNMDICVTVDLRTPLPELDWARVKKIGLRDYQYEHFVKFLFAGKDDSGLGIATGAFGKSFLQMATYAAWNSLNTILAIPLNAIYDNTYKKFVEYFPDKHVGRVGGGFHDISTDITITTFKSLPSCATEKCQLFLADEVHKTTGDVIQNDITKLRPIRSFGYTATDKGLFSGADKVIKGLFGERLIHIPYDAALEMDAVVPGVVYFLRIPKDVMVNGSSTEYKIKNGIKCCEERNALIGQAVAKIPKDWQTMIFVDHVADHLVNLHKYLPQGTRFIHRESSKKRVGKYALTAKEQKAVLDDFKAGKFQYLVATDCCGTGFDVIDCRVVVQASGGSSEIEVLQEAYRGARIVPKELEGPLGVKKMFILIDFLDNHEEVLHNMAMKRMSFYKKQGWTVRTVDRPEDIDWNYHGKKEL